MSKKINAWLIWNGVYSQQGQCNAQGFKQPVVAGPNRMTITVGRPGRPIPPPTELVADDAISVRLDEVRAWGEAGNEFLLIHTRLKRVVGIKSLLLLIYRSYDPQNPVLSQDTLVYQEVLTAAQIQRLADSDPTSSPDWESIAKPGAAREAKQAQPTQAARKEHAPYKVRVWVSKDANAFAGFDGSTFPQEVYGITVHEQTQSWKKRGGKYLDPKLDDKPDEVDAAEWQRLISKWQRLAQDELGRNLSDLVPSKPSTPTPEQPPNPWKAAKLEQFRIQLLDDSKQPLIYMDYLLEISEWFLEGQTDSAGWIDVWIPADTEQGQLYIGDEEIELHFTDLKPMQSDGSLEDDIGFRTRLQGLGFLATEAQEEDAFMDAVIRFQNRYAPEAALEIDDEQWANLLRTRMREVYQQ